MGRQVVYNQEAREALKRGVDILANAVKVTLGPKGRNVIIDRDGYDPIITKDGVTVARFVYVNSPLENIGAQMVKQVAKQTAETAGDGTTTATVLAQAIVAAGIKNVTAGANPMDIKKGIDKAVALIVADLKSQSVIIGEDQKSIIQIATISANGDDVIGKLIADAFKSVGNEGVITIEESNSTETSVKVVEGFQFEKGFVSPFFVNSPAKMEVQFDNPDFLLIGKKVNSLKELIPIMEKQMRRARPLVIVADEVEGEALQGLVINKNKNGLNIAAVRSPGFTNSTKTLMLDLAIATGATVVGDESGNPLDKAELNVLGSADRVVINKSSTIILKGKGSKEHVQNRVLEIKMQIEESDNTLDKNNLRDRIAKLAGGIAVLYIGAATDIEMKEKKDRVDDALHATRAAIAEGIVPGGGVALVRSLQAIAELKGDNEDENTGIDIIRRAIEEPLRQICTNAGHEPSVIIDKVKKSKGGHGYNARTDKYENLIKAGVVDPTKVTRIALENAASIASMLLTTECVLCDEGVDDIKK